LKAPLLFNQTLPQATQVAVICVPDLAGYDLAKSVDREGWPTNPPSLPQGSLKALPKLERLSWPKSHHRSGAGMMFLGESSRQLKVDREIALSTAPSPGFDEDVAKPMQLVLHISGIRAAKSCRLRRFPIDQPSARSQG
jgi:hypothetical protein